MKTYRPTTKSRRKMTTVSYRGVVTSAAPLKSLLSGRKRHVGRNSAGRITVRHKGAGHKRLFREVDFRYDKENIPARVETIEYDPNRTSFIALICYKDGARSYVLAPAGIKVGDTMLTGPDAPVAKGNRLPLSKIPVGTFIYNISLQPGTDAKLVRSAGTYAEVQAADQGFVNVKLPSTEVRRIPETAYASIGALSNEEHHLEVIGKAGRSRWKGRRPHVRGTAMNPVDHPHGGGEGVQGIGLRLGPKAPWGKQAYGVRTRTPKKYSNVHIVSRRRKKTRG